MNGERLSTSRRWFSEIWEQILPRAFASLAILRTARRYFSESDFFDLQVLFNLVWIDPMLRKRDPFLSSLVIKGRGYSEEEKSLLVEKGLSILRDIIPKYKELLPKAR
jgi:alpha-amylase/alpha-mannosidase (GH57 family)